MLEKMGFNYNFTHLYDGFSFYLSVVISQRGIFMSKEIKFGLDRLVEAGLGKNWSEYWREQYKRFTPLLKRHFMLEQFASYFLTKKEFFREREDIESKLTEDEWLLLIKNAGIVQGKIEYTRRMLLHFSHLTSDDIKRKLGYK